MGIYFKAFVTTSSEACVVDLTPPTFAGITGLASNSDGSLGASWSAGSDSSGPIEYDIFIQQDSATGLFNSSNLVFSTQKLLARIYTDANGYSLSRGRTYFVGVRARDRLGNTETNTVSLSAGSSGVDFSRASVLTAGPLMEIQKGAFDMSIESNSFNMEIESPEENI